MIGTIRRHSAWLWWVVATLTIISFIWWGASPGTRNGGGRNAGYGSLYGKPVTRDEFNDAQREFDIYWWRRNGDFPTAAANRTDLDEGTYERLILKAKAKELGIHVSEEQVAAAANEFLSSLGRDRQAVPMNAFLDRILTPAGLTAADFQRYLAGNVAVDQLIQTMGLSGELVTPQEAGQIFDRENQEVSAQAVFFSGSNYFSQVTITPSVIQAFYTNHMAIYREPDRVQVNYLEYDLTNYLKQVTQKLGETNITARVDAAYAQNGRELVPDATSPAEAKVKIREMVVRQAAAAMAADEAKQFLATLFAMEQPMPEDLVKLARKQGLPVHTTAPFSAADGPEEFPAPAELTQTAFKLNADSPFSTRPIVGAEAVYIIGLDRRIPSAIPSLDQIHGRVVSDYQNHEAAVKAREACTNFYFSASVQMASGKTFAQTAMAAGLTPFALKPFSLSSPAIPEAEGKAQVNEVKSAAFTTQPGHLSHVEPTAQGAFVLYVQSLLPVDEALKKSELPDYLAQLRRQRQIEAFNAWMNAEMNREIRNTPIYDELTGRKGNPQ